jgi:hypothetical protein
MFKSKSINSSNQPNPLHTSQTPFQVETEYSFQVDPPKINEVHLVQLERSAEHARGAWRAVLIGC